MTQRHPSAVKLVWGQAMYQNKIFFRNPTAAFFTLLFPLLIFIVFSLIFGNQPIIGLGINVAQYYAPALAVFGVVSATYSNLAATTAYQRDEGILKRIKGTPLPPSLYMGGKVLSATMIATLSAVIMMVVGVVGYGVHIYADTLLAVIVTFLVGVACFASLGLMVAAFVSSGDAATAVTNATLLPLAFISGVFIIPSDEAPAWLDPVASIFPLKHFAEPFVAAFNPLHTGSGFAWSSLGVMVLWGAAGVLIAVRFFSWEATPGPSRKERRDRKAAAKA